MVLRDRRGPRTVGEQTGGPVRDVGSSRSWSARARACCRTRPPGSPRSVPASAPSPRSTTFWSAVSWPANSSTTLSIASRWYCWLASNLISTGHQTVFSVIRGSARSSTAFAFTASAPANPSSRNTTTRAPRRARPRRPRRDLEAQHDRDAAGDDHWGAAGLVAAQGRRERTPSLSRTSAAIASGPDFAVDRASTRADQADRQGPQVSQPESCCN